MSLYDDMIQIWVDRRAWDLAFHDHCKELITAFFRVFRQQTGAHPLRPLHVDDLSPRAERDYSLAEAMKPIARPVEKGRTALCGYEVCLGLLLEGPPEDSPRQMLAVDLTVMARAPQDRSCVTLSLLGCTQDFRLPLVLPAIEVDLAPGDKPFPSRPPGEPMTDAQQLSWLQASLRNFRRLPPERRGALAREWKEHAGKLGMLEGPEPSSAKAEGAPVASFSQEEAASLRRSEVLREVQHVLLAVDPQQADQNQRGFEELSRAVSRELCLLLLAGESAPPSGDEAAGFSFRPLDRPPGPRP